MLESKEAQVLDDDATTAPIMRVWNLGFQRAEKWLLRGLSLNPQDPEACRITRRITRRTRPTQTVRG
jgi:hypothetical protein